MRIPSIRQFFKLAKPVAPEVAPRSLPLTKTFTDTATGVIRMERPIMRDGKQALAIMEKFPDGKIKTTIKGDGDNPCWRTKTITREAGASVFGGDKITINKDYTKYWCHNENINLTKEYNPNGSLEHTQLSLIHTSGNGLQDYKFFATQDRVYEEYPISHSVKEMIKSPKEHEYYQHALNNVDNYDQFSNRQTNYGRIVKANEQAKIEAETKAKEAAKVAKEAEEKALKELRAKQPRINVAKVLGINVDELKVVEKVQPNGAIKRYYFMPETGIGKRKPVITTYDHGILHTEKIIGSSKADMIYMKQVGQDTPYIVAKKGNYTQVSTLNDFSELTNRQYYNDGIASLKNEYLAGKINFVNGKIQINDEKATELMNLDSYYKRVFSEFPNIHVINGEPSFPKLGEWKPIYQKFQTHINNLKQEAQKNYIDLNDMYKSFEA